MKASTNNLTIVINTCDAYSDVLSIFFYAFNEYWPDCPYQIVINTETCIYEYPVKVHNYYNNSENDDWGDRLRLTLIDIETEYVLMLYDDYILDLPVSNNKIESALNVLKSQPLVAVTYLVDTKLPLDLGKKDDNFVALKDKQDYRLSSAPGIWRKKILINYIFPGDTPWAWELFGSYRAWNDGYIYYALNPENQNIYSYNFEGGGAIYRGKWVQKVVKEVSQKYKLNIDWSKRGFASERVNEKRSLKWKINFFIKGYNMVGFKALRAIPRYILAKYYAK